MSTIQLNLIKINYMCDLKFFWSVSIIYFILFESQQKNSSEKQKTTKCFNLSITLVDAIILQTFWFVRERDGKNFISVLSLSTKWKNQHKEEIGFQWGNFV